MIPRARAVALALCRRLAASLVAAAFLAAAQSSFGTAGPSPAPPRVSVDTDFPASSGRTLRVPAGGSLAAALAGARPGDVVSLQAGATYRGPFVLPRKDGPGWIVITSSAAERLPAPGRRVAPSDARVMPALEAASGAVLTAAPGAHHYRFVGIEIRPATGAFLYDLVELAAPSLAPETAPHHVVFDRCYIHGDPARGSRRGIAMNGSAIAVVDSYLSDFKEAGADSQAVAGWTGAGPFLLRDDYLEAAGENVMFGGGDPAVPGLVPSDIEIRRNRFSKPLAWKEGDAAFEGVAWTVKNLLELKNARRVLIDGNDFDTTWAAAQSGFAIVFTVRNEGGTAPWSTVEDVAFTRNLVRHAGAGVNILGRDDSGHSSGRTERILIRDNLFVDIGDAPWGGKGTLFQLLNGTADVVIERNTGRQTGAIVVADGSPNDGFVFRANVAPHNEYGIVGSGTRPGEQTLDRYFPGAVVQDNVIIGGRPDSYPAGNSFSPSHEVRRPGVRAAGVAIDDLLRGLGYDRLPPDVERPSR